MGRKVETVPGSEVNLRAPLVISSIGSLPERIAGLAMKGETYTFNSGDTGEYEALPGVFGLGNVVTGKGNIRESEEHGESVARHVATSYLGAKDKLAPGPATVLLERARRRQREVGYDGDYAAWMSRNTPADLE